jgi:hypothetical protein
VTLGWDRKPAAPIVRTSHASGLFPGRRSNSAYFPVRFFRITASPSQGGVDLSELPSRSGAKISSCGLRQELSRLKAIILRPNKLRSPNETVVVEAGKQPGQLFCAWLPSLAKETASL